MKKTAIFYGPVGGSTEFVAKRILKLLGEDNCALVAVADADREELLKYENIIFGISTIGNETWNSEPLKSGWFSFMNTLDQTELEGKTIALFGLGDQIRYANHFVDAMGDLYELLSAKNVKIIGAVDPSVYEFKNSKALFKGKFVGLPIDEDFESDLTLERISSWVKMIKPQFS